MKGPKMLKLFQTPCLEVFNAWRRITKGKSLGDALALPHGSHA